MAFASTGNTQVYVEKFDVSIAGTFYNYALSLTDGERWSRRIPKEKISPGQFLDREPQP